MVAGEGAGGDVRSDYVGEDIRWSHPDALRAAVLTANGIHARARWETKQSIDYSTFRFALKDASGGKLRRAPEPFDGAPEPSPSASISFSASDDPRRDAGRHSPASARTRYGFAPALVANAFSAGSENATPRIAKSPVRLGDRIDESEYSAPRVARWSRGDARKETPAKLAIGRADGRVDILATRETRVFVDGDAGTSDGAFSSRVGYRFDVSCSLVPTRLNGDTHDVENENAPIADVDWSAAGDRLVTACEDGDVRVWSLLEAEAEAEAPKTKQDEELKNATDVSVDEDGNETASAETWRCVRVVACGDRALLSLEGRLADEKIDPRCDDKDEGAKDEGARRNREGVARLPPVVAARFHPLNNNLIFVARRSRSVWVVNASTGYVSARVGSSSAVKKNANMPADLSAACVDAVGSFVYVGDIEGRVLALRYTRADANRGGRFPFVATRRISRAVLVSGVSGAVVEREPTSSADLGSGSASRKNDSVGVSPSQSGEHAIAFAGGAAPPTTFGRGDGTEILSVSYAPFAKATGGAAVFATFRCGAVRAYKTTFEALSKSAATKKNGRNVPFPRRRRGALTPTLTAFVPAWPGVSRTLSRFVAIAPAMDPASPVECAAAVAGGGAATYALPSVDGAPVNRSGALAATARDEREKEKPVAVCAAFDAAGAFLVVGYEDGGVLLWKRAASL